MGRREQIRGRLKAVERGEPLRWHVQETEDSRREWRGEIADSDSIFALVTKPDDNPVADLIAHAPSDLRDLLAVADAAHHYRDVVAAAYGPGDAAYEEAIDLLFAALDRLDNGGDR